eukprot:CAMPEP_0116889134 /NCGR_PEP_ID=MMETSP0463-20121206/24506_1 /TAXON_ID=181622 /ORGANISM="Strombidinopsis sp, Strain SopsisLIS2011" /LENGTH=46 /DNA_ID= /DNA_START= /DNA_END= /DNA_ORIENTATION=
MALFANYQSDEGDESQEFQNSDDDLYANLVPDEANDDSPVEEEPVK